MTEPAARMPALVRLALMAACSVIVFAGIGAARSVVGPVVIAVLITIAWSPASRWLQRRGVPPTLAALTGIVVGIVAIALFVLLVWVSLLQLQANLPDYQTRLGELRDGLNVLLADLPVDASRVLSSEAFQPSAIVGYTLTLIRRLTTAAGNLSILVLIMAFLMIEAERYPQKLYDSLASFHIPAERVDAFVLSMRSYVGINAVFGLVAATLNTLLLLAIGVDFAVLWGVLSFLLSFLPNVGFLLALVPPALLALLQFGFGRAIAVIVGFVVINFVVDNVIKPRFVGESLDLSPAVVVLSLVFWGWLLGPIGALLAVPMSIALRFLLESFDELRWLAYLMSDKDAKGSKQEIPQP